MLGIIIAIISGICMSFQGVFNTRLGEKIGIWETNLIVQLIGLIITAIITFAFGKGNLKEVTNANKIYLLGGLLGVIILFTVMKSIGYLGPTLSTSIILISQLLSATFIEYLGLFDTDKINFTLKDFIGIAIMILGIIVFKWKR